MRIVDWAGREYGVGDTVLYTSSKGRGLNYGVVEKIDTKNYAKYKYPNGHFFEEHRRVRIKSIFDDNSHTIIEGIHPVAFVSITSFKAR